MWYKTLLLLGLIFITTLSADRGKIQKEKTRILIVPFDRVNFYSQIEIPIILSSNGLVDDEEIYFAYKEKLTKTLAASSADFSFFELPEAEINTLKKQIPVIHKMTPISHYGVDLDRMRDSSLIRRYLKNFNADYILFLCRYEINAKLFSSSKSFEGSTFVSWSRHEVDYELFNANQELVALGSSFSLIPKRPEDSTYLTYGVKIEGMHRAYEDLKKDIIKKEQSYKGKAVYKLKKVSN